MTEVHAFTGDQPRHDANHKDLYRARASEIAVVFRDPPHMIVPKMENRRGNAMIIHLQPDEGNTLRNTIKEPGPGGFRLAEVTLDMTFADALGGQADPQDAYERLIMDVIRGDQTRFIRRSGRGGVGLGRSDHRALGRGAPCPRAL